MSPLQINENVHQICAGLEDFGIGGIVALRLDHRRQLGCEIDVRLFQRSRNDPPQATSSRKPDPHISGFGGCGIDVACRVDVPAWQLEVELGALAAAFQSRGWQVKQGPNTLRIRRGAAPSAPASPSPSPSGTPARK